MVTIQAVLPELLDHETGTMPADFVPDNMGRQEFSTGHRQRCAGSFHQPRCQTQMIRMKMSHDQTIHRTIEAIEYLRPCLAYSVIRKPGINNHPTRAIAQQPEIDVIKLKRQRHAQPENARGNFCQLASSRVMRMGIMQGHEKTESDDQNEQLTIR